MEITICRKLSDGYSCFISQVVNQCNWLCVSYSPLRSFGLSYIGIFYSRKLVAFNIM